MAERVEERLQFRIGRRGRQWVFRDKDRKLVIWDTASTTSLFVQVGRWYNVRYTFSHMDGEHKCVKRLVIVGEVD